MKTAKMHTCPIRESVMEEDGCATVKPEDFTGAHCSYTFIKEPYDLSLIDRETSMEEIQNRWDAKLNKDKLEQYVLSMKLGDTFPAIVLIARRTETATGYELRYLVADGFHRLNVLDKLGYTHVSGIYIFSHAEDVRIATHFNNRTSGVPEDVEDTLERVARDYLAEQDTALKKGTNPPTHKSWAERNRVPEGKLTRKLDTLEAKLWLTDNGIVPTNIKHDSTFTAINMVCRRSQPDALRIARIANYGLTTTQMKEIVDGYRDSTKTNEEREAFLVGEERKWGQKTNNGTSQRRASTKRNRPSVVIMRDDLKKVISRFSKVEDKNAFAKLLKLNEDDRKQYVAVAKFILDHCEAD